MLKRFKDAVKFNFTVSPDDVTLDCLNKWEPHLLAVTCTRRSKKRSTKPIAWERSTENPAKLVVRWSIPENLEMMVTFYRDTDKTHFDDKEWNFILEEIDGSRRKPLASEVINLASLAAVSQAEQKSLVLKLRPISSKIASAELALTLSWVFVKAGNSKDDDMQSVASFDAISNHSFDDGAVQLKRNHHGGSDASPFERSTPGRSTTSFETGRRFANFFKSHRNKEKSPKTPKITDGTRTLPVPSAIHKPALQTLESVDGAVGNSPDHHSGEATTPTTTVSVSVHSDLTSADSPVRLSESPKESVTVIRRSALPSDFLKTVAERQKEMANKKARPVYEGTPPSSPETEDKPLELPPPSEIDPPSSFVVLDPIVSQNNQSAEHSVATISIAGATPVKNIKSDQGGETSNLDVTDSDPNEGANGLSDNQNQQSEVNLQGLDLLDWCKQVTSGYPGVCVTNLTTSWRNGLAFAATIHHFRPDLIDWEELIKAQSQSQLVYKRVLDAVLALNVMSLPWEHGSAIDLNAVPDRLLVTKFLYELRQKLSNASQEPEIEHIEPEDYPPVIPRDDSNNGNMVTSTDSTESRNVHESKVSKLSPSSSLSSSDRPRVVSPVPGAPPKPAPGTPLMTRQQFYNPLDSDDEDSSNKDLLNLFIKPPPVPQRTNAPAPSSSVSPVKTPNIQRAASSPKTKIRVIKPSSQSGSQPECVFSASSSADSCGSLALPKVVEVPAAELMSVSTASPSGRPRPSPPASPKILASSDSNLTKIFLNCSATEEDQQQQVQKNNSGSTSRLRDVLSSRPILTFPDEIDHVPLPEQPVEPASEPQPVPPSNIQQNGHHKGTPPPPSSSTSASVPVSNGGTSSTVKLQSGVSTLIDVEPGEQETLARQQTAIEKETADIQNLLQRMALTGDRDMEPTLLQRLFVLVNRKDAIVRRKFQVDLVEKEKQLMQERDEIEQQLRQLLGKEDDDYGQLEREKPLSRFGDTFDRTGETAAQLGHPQRTAQNLARRTIKGKTVEEGDLQGNDVGSLITGGLQDRTSREMALEADLMNRLRAVVLERESVVEQLDLQTAEIEHDEEMSSMNRIVVRAVPASENNPNNNAESNNTEYRSANNNGILSNRSSQFLRAPQQPAVATTAQSQSIASAASPRLGRFFAQRASAFRGWLSGST